MPVSIGARTAFEKFIMDRQKAIAGQLGKKDYQITPQEYDKAAEEFFGPIPLPQGAVEVSRTGTSLTYKGPDGKTYTAKRNTDSNLGSVDIGRIETSLGEGTGVLQPLIGNQSAAGEQDYAKQLLAQVQNYFNNQFANAEKSPGQVAGTQQWLDALFGNAQKLGQTPSLAGLDPQTQAALKAITDAQLGQLNQQFTDQSGELTAKLFGQGINRSSIAGTQANRLLQGQGLVTQQALSDAASRELGIRQLLTQLGQQGLMAAGDQYGQGGNLALGSYRESNAQAGKGIDLLMALLNQALQRETAGVSLGLEDQQIRNQQSQFDKNYGLANTQYETQAQAQRQQAHRALVNSIISGVAGFALPLGTSLFSKSGEASNAGASGANPGSIWPQN